MCGFVCVWLCVCWCVCLCVCVEGGGLCVSESKKKTIWLMCVICDTDSDRCRISACQGAPVICFCNRRLIDKIN